MHTTTLNSTDAELTRRAKRRVGMKLGFMTHLIVYLFVNGALVLLNAAQGGERWVHWPMFGWGIGLAIHGIVTFIGLQGDGLRDRLLAEEIERLKARR